MITIPLLNKPLYEFIVDLDGTDYQITVRYNTREDCYFIDISDATTLDQLLSGVRCVVGVPLLQYSKDVRLPRGQLLFLDTQREDKDPALGELGTRCVLIYASESELG